MNRYTLGMDTSGQKELTNNAPSDQEMLTQFLADRDVLCPACNYNIRQLQGNTCPECGCELLLNVGYVGLSNKWITALVGALVPAACGIPFHILMLIALSQGAPIGELASEGIGILFLLLEFYALNCAVVSILLLVMRQRFTRLKMQTQTTIASILVGAAVIAGIMALSLIASL